MKDKLVRGPLGASDQAKPRRNSDGSDASVYPPMAELAEVKSKNRLCKERWLGGL